MSTRRSLMLSVYTTLVVAVALGGCASTPPAPSQAIAVMQATPSPARRTATPAPTPTPTLSPSPSPTFPPPDPTIADLTGVTTDPALAHRLPLAVLIDDNRIARPQSGFNGASIVYQAPADGGETRYMFVFQEGDSKAIGPVRSGRIYFVHWAAEIKAAIAHYGGDRISRAQITSYDPDRLTNVDALGSGAKAYHRIKSRKAPHNGYTSTTALRAMALKLGGPVSEPTDLFRRTFLAPTKAASLPASQRIRIPYRTGLVEYHFDRATDLYRRVLDGKLQVDPADGKRVTTRNVVVLFMSFRTDSTIEVGHARPVVGSIGTGRALVFREGRVTEGTWSKPDEVSPTRVLDGAGNEIPLVTGRTFFQIVPIGTNVTTGR